MDLELGAGFLIAQFSASSLRGRRFSEDEKALASLLSSPLFRGGLHSGDAQHSLFLKGISAGDGEGAVFMDRVTAEAPIKRMFASTFKAVSQTVRVWVRGEPDCQGLG